MTVVEVDVLIVGAGFGGCYLLKHLRDHGFKVKIFEAGEGLGGVWNNNRYPGARVDTEIPYYSYSDPDLWNNFTWSQRYPDHYELRRYFNYVDRQWSLSRDVVFGAQVVDVLLQDDGRWLINTAKGQQCKCRWFIAATGTSFKPHIPEWPGYVTFNGIVHHSAQWPQEGVDVRGKRVAIIGAGASAIQIMQEVSKEALTVTNFIRSPNIAIPMRQRNLSKEEYLAYKPAYEAIFAATRRTWGSSPYSANGKLTFEDPPGKRQAFWEEQWRRGGVSFIVGGQYRDTQSDKRANRELYNFWSLKTRARISDPVKRDLLAPVEPPYWYMTKRPSLEQDYYEMCDQPHVEITNEPIERFEQRGIRTTKKLREFDVIAVATGFDAITGGLRTMNIKGRGGIELQKKWKEGVYTHLGTLVNGFPNMFMVYGPQAPTSLTAGVPFIEQQCGWILNVICKMRNEKVIKAEPTRDAELSWRQTCLDLGNLTLLPETDSWWNGANGIKGKPKEILLYVGGVPAWRKACDEALEGWRDFDISQVTPSRI